MPLSLSSPLGVFALCSVALVLNLFFLSNFTALVRVKNKIVVNKEDVDVVKGGVVDAAEHPSVTRVHRAHRNAIENMVPFWVMATLYVMTGPSTTGAWAYLGTFTATRWLHSICYLAGLQPWRTVMFVIGTLATAGMLVHVVIAVL